MAQKTVRRYLIVRDSEKVHYKIEVLVNANNKINNKLVPIIEKQNRVQTCSVTTYKNYNLCHQKEKALNQIITNTTFVVR